MTGHHHLFAECSWHNHNWPLEHQVALHCEVISKIIVGLNCFHGVGLVLRPALLDDLAEFTQYWIVS